MHMSASEIVQRVHGSSLPTKLDELILWVDDYNFEPKPNRKLNPYWKYYRQRTGWTCGCACIRMVLHSLLNIRKSEEELVKIMKTDKINGTLQSNLIQVGEYFKEILDCQYGEYGSVYSTLTKLTTDGWVCIVEYSLDDLPHIAVFCYDDDIDIYLNDPMFGELFRINKNEFIRRWNVRKDNWTDFVLQDVESCRFYIAFKKKP